MMHEHFRIRASWGSRPETAASCAGRLARMLGRLSAADPVLGCWCKGANTREEANEPFCKMPPDLKELEEKFEAERIYYDVPPDRLWPEMGFSVGAWTGRDEPYAANFLVRPGGFDPPYPRFKNHAELRMSDLKLQDGQPWGEYDLRCVMLTVAESWDAPYALMTQNYLGSVIYPETGPDYISAQAGWLTYLAAPWAALLHPPEGAKTERFTNGAILVTIGAPTFSVDNPEDMRLAREMRRAMMPVQEAWNRPETAPW